MYTIDAILKIITSVKVSISNPALEVQRLEYDSRKIRQGELSLFFALKNIRDGHHFIDDAYHKGVRNFIISDPVVFTDKYPDANFISVEDTMRALQELAAFHRRRHAIPVVGITGSNGKTIVKEWLFQLLSVDLMCFESPKSYNSQLGVALSLWDIQVDHQIALIEAGISRPGEMEQLEVMIRPDIGVFTSIGSAHADGFVSKGQKLEEKWTLFRNCKTIIAPSDIVPQDLRDSRCFLWGTTPGDDIYIESIERIAHRTVIKVTVADNAYVLEIPFQDKASVENVMTCVATLLVLGYEMSVIQNRIGNLQPLEMRLKLKKGKNNCSIVDDSYSNDFASLKIALDFMEQQNQHEARSLVITDFIGVIWDDKFKAKLVHLLNSIAFRKVVLVGGAIHEIADSLMHAQILTFRDTDSLLSALYTVDFRDETVLIKGARKFELERLSQLLVQKSHDTVLEINLKALEHNLSQYRSKLAPDVKLMAMVKAFSYGSGSFEIANVLQFNKVDYLTVAFVDEGVELRQGGIQLPIMVLSPHIETFDDVLKYSLEPEIYSMKVLRAFIDFLKDKNVVEYPIHLKLDTGMHRLGFMPDELDELLRVLKYTDKDVIVKSVFSHLVGAGNPDLDDFTTMQVDLFREEAEKLEKSLRYEVIKHICNSNAIIHRRKDHMNMVRLGIGLYGVDMAPQDLNLQQVGTLKTTITQIKHLKTGETVGYDRKGKLYQDSKIATVKIGYADGYDRRFGNGVGKMRIHGHTVPTVGNICMDMCMLDITDIEAIEGEEVVVFPDIMQAAKDIGTIPYELLAGISSRVKREYYYE
ncbi:bifunctional UDP-N-acetylmuramoyl-tripeptide:D-alanyl-D-alanine ligase/alanine racemase [Sphingobacterium sp. SGG-5]|nr:bifunctional UDP-N-acetylmuramoyl-tripeptide:D-alanyl-D-alanine ligase/alanine racemase [Sphingobacterium sp. SGG-5]